MSMTIISVLMVMILCLSGFVMTVGAEEMGITVVIDENTVDFGQEQLPFLAESGRTLVPMRKIFEAMGATLQWAEDTQTVTATKGDNTIVIRIGDKVAKKNNIELTMDQPAELISGRTFVPIRFVSESLGAKVDWIDETKTILINTVTSKNLKVLAIGNSFSTDAGKYLHDIAAADGMDLTFVNLYIGAANLKKHWDNAETGSNSYAYELNGESTGKMVSIEEVLLSDDWDYITMQQGSFESGIEDSYYPYIELLAKNVKELEPNAELIIHQTWAYEKDSKHKGFLNYNSNQATMFNAVKAAYDKASTKVGLLTLVDGTEVSPGKKPLRIIPAGKAFQNARENPIFNTSYGDGNLASLNRDGYHASLSFGRYLLGAVWYECLTGNQIANNTFSPSDVLKSELDTLKKAAHDAVIEYGWK